MNLERIFEIAPGATRYGRREFVGYFSSHLPCENGPPFITFSIASPTLEETLEAINKVVADYVNAAGEGHIHWRQGMGVEEDKEGGGYRAFARLVVHPHLPKLA